MVTTYGGRTFDRIERVDPRSFDHLWAATVYVSAEDKVLQSEIDALTKRVAALEAAVTPAPAPAPTPPAPSYVRWSNGTVLDQGQTGMCVGYAWAGFAETGPHAEPIVVGKGGDDESSTADAIYDQARKDDGDANIEDPQGGASTTGGASAAKQLGFIKSYSWVLNVSQMRAALKAGPLVGGFPWRSTMFTPGTAFVLDVGDKSKDVGGHEFVIVGDIPAGTPGGPSQTEDMAEMLNSWGLGWANGGRAYIPWDGVADLLADGGDCTAPVR